jgi:hypothetical protein
MHIIFCIPQVQGDNKNNTEQKVRKYSFWQFCMLAISVFTVTHLRMNEIQKMFFEWKLGTVTDKP